MVSMAREWTGIQERDSALFDDLFKREYPRVMAVAQRVLGDTDAAEDVAQDVFCSFYRQHPPTAAYAAPWLYRAAAHTALNVIRGRRRRLQRETSDALSHQRLASHAEVSLDPQRATEIDESRREVREALARIPEKSASVLALRYSGLSYAEVAGAIGTKPGQVGTLLRRAEAALRKEMTDETLK